jgi:hypothetical protein
MRIIRAEIAEQIARFCHPEVTPACATTSKHARSANFIRVSCTTVCVEQAPEEANFASSKQVRFGAVTSADSGVRGNEMRAGEKERHLSGREGHEGHEGRDLPLPYTRVRHLLPLSTPLTLLTLQHTLASLRRNFSLSSLSLSLSV